MNSERPRKLTAEMLAATAKEIATDLIKASHFKEDDRAGIEEDLAKVGDAWKDGYRLASDLEDRCGWDPDAMMVEELDSFATLARRQIELAQKAWAETESIQPSHPVGTRVVLKSKETGEITGVYEHGAAQFLVKIDGDPAAEMSNARRIVYYEDVTPLEAA